MTDTQEHLGIGKEYEFNDDEKYVVKPLGSKYFGHTIRLINAMRKRFKDETKTPTGDEILSVMAEEPGLSKTIGEMISATMNQIFAEVEKTEDELNAFASKNLFYLFKAMLEQNLPKLNKEDRTKSEKIKRMQKFRDESHKQTKKPEQKQTA